MVSIWLILAGLMFDLPLVTGLGVGFLAAGF